MEEQPHRACERTKSNKNNNNKKKNKVTFKIRHIKIDVLLFHLGYK